MEGEKPEVGETRKLTYVVICLSLLVFVLVGVGPSL